MDREEKRELKIREKTDIKNKQKNLTLGKKPLLRRGVENQERRRQETTEGRSLSSHWTTTRKAWRGLGGGGGGAGNVPVIVGVANGRESKQPKPARAADKHGTTAHRGGGSSNGISNAIINKEDDDAELSHGDNDQITWGKEPNERGRRK